MRAKRRRGRLAFGIFSVFLGILVLGVGSVQLGVFDRALASRANETLAQSVPEPLSLTTGSTKVGFSWPPSLGVRYEDFKIFDAQTDTVIAKVDRLSVNLDLIKSALGTPVFSSLAIEGAQLDIASARPLLSDQKPEQITLAGVPQWFETISDQLEDAFAASERAQAPLRLSVKDSHAILPANQYSDTLVVQSAQARLAAGELSVKSLSDLAGQTVVFNATAQRENDGVIALETTAQDVVFPVKRLRTFLSDNMDDHEPEASPLPVLLDLKVSMRHDFAGDEKQLSVSFTPDDLSFKLSDDDYVPLRGGGRLTYEFDDNSLTLERDLWQFGRSSAIVSARVRDLPDRATEGEFQAFLPLEFEVLFNRGRIEPEDSPEAPLTFASRVQGSFTPATGLLDFTNLELDTSEGYATSEGVIALADNPPVALFDVSTKDMSVTGLKQLWPGTVAREARRWTLNNLAGGQVLRSRFQIAEPLRRRIEGSDQRLLGDSRIEMTVEGVRFDLTGDLPPVRDGSGDIVYADRITTLNLEEGNIFLPSGRSAITRNATLVIQPPDEAGFVMARGGGEIEGNADAIGEIIQLRPIEAQNYYPFEPSDLTGKVKGNIELYFALNGFDEPNIPDPDWSVALSIQDAGSKAAIEERLLSGLEGTIDVTPQRAIIDVAGNMDGFDAAMAMTIPFPGADVAPEQRVELQLDDASRKLLAPGLEIMLTGVTPTVVEGSEERLQVNASLVDSTLVLPWIGWQKGRGIPASISFDLVETDARTSLNEFVLDGDGFGARGRLEVDQVGLLLAQFDQVSLNPGDSFGLRVERDGERYDVNVSGSTVDLRALIRHVRDQLQASAETADQTPVNVDVRFDTVAGFNGETMRNVVASARVRNGGVERFSVTGLGASGMPFSVALNGQGADRRMRVEAFDAGEFLRFVDLYGQIQGGALGLDLKAVSNGDLTGPLEIRDFRIFNEPALDRLVSTRRDERGSLREALNRDLDLREVPFDVGVANLTFGTGTLDVSEAYIRGPVVGFSMQGRVFDQENQTRITGTFLPAYGLNSAFAEIPILGLVLGNGRERGLIGVTFLLAGDFDSPRVTVNPLSVIAPGIFRNIFEFR
ncbi:MAG: AsmA-like C-terminal region-containing protein [Pseudomonadota bacterium]